MKEYQKDVEEYLNNRPLFYYTFDDLLDAINKYDNYYCLLDSLDIEQIEEFYDALYANLKIFFDNYFVSVAQNILNQYLQENLAKTKL